MKKLQILNSSLLIVLVLIGLYIVSNQLYDYKAVRTIIHVNDEYAKRILLDPGVMDKQVSLFESDSASASYILNQMESRPGISLEILQTLKQQGILDETGYRRAKSALHMREL